MKYLNSLIILLTSTITFSCSPSEKGVYFSEMKEKPKLFLNDKILTVKTQNSIKHSALLIYEINTQVDKANKVLSLSANQSINKKYKDTFEINLVELGISNNFNEWKIIWLDPDTTKNELYITEQDISQNLDNEIINKGLEKENLKKIYQYINNNNLAVCAKNHKFLGVYLSPITGTMIGSIFLGNYDLMNDRKIISSKIYYVAGLTECTDKEFNDTSTNNFYIKLGSSFKMRYYNFAGNVTYENRNLFHFQSTDIRNPPTMNATFKSIKVPYENVYFPEAYGSDYKDELNFSDLAKKSIQALFKDFKIIETEYKRL